MADMCMSDPANVGSAGAQMVNCTKIATITDDTHITLSYKAEGVQTAYFGSWPGGTASYAIYAGGIIQGPVNVLTGTGPVSITLDTVAAFSPGSVTQMFASNAQQMGGSLIHLGLQLPGPVIQGNGFGGVGDGYRVDTPYGNAPQGNVLSGYGSFTGGVWIGFTPNSQGITPRCGLCIVGTGSTVGPSYVIDDADHASSTIIAMNLRNYSGVATAIAYDRSASNHNWWSLGQMYITDDGRISLISSPQTNEEFYVYNNTATTNMFHASIGGNHLNNNVSALRLEDSGIPFFWVRGLGSGNYEADLNNGTKIKGYSDNQSTVTWTLDSSAGTANFTSGYKVNGNTVIPSTVTGYQGNASGVKAQLADGTCASGNLCKSDANGNLTNGPSATTPTFSGSVRATQVIADQGSACTNGELALSAGWQSTGSATVTGVVGTGQTCEWTITTGTTTAANPTITDTLTNALPSANTVCWMIITGGNRTAAAGDSFDQTTLSATAPVFTFQGTPTAGGKTYKVVRTCGP